METLIILTTLATFVGTTEDLCTTQMSLAITIRLKTPTSHNEMSMPSHPLSLVKDLAIWGFSEFEKRSERRGFRSRITLPAPSAPPSLSPTSLVPPLNFPLTIPLPLREKKVVIGVVSVVCVLVLLLLFLAFWVYCKLEDKVVGILRKHNFDDIKKATNNFSRDNIIRKGGYGNVYKGLLSDWSEVAFKRFKNCSAASDAS